MSQYNRRVFFSPSFTVLLVGSQFPNQGLNLCPQQKKVQSPSHWTARKFPRRVFKNSQYVSNIILDFVGYAHKSRNISGLTQQMFSFFFIFVNSYWEYDSQYESGKFARRVTLEFRLPPSYNMTISTPQFQGREESMENSYPLLSTLDQKCDTCHFCSQPIGQNQSQGPNLIPGRLGNAGEHVEYLVSTIVSAIANHFSPQF